MSYLVVEVEGLHRRRGDERSSGEIAVEQHVMQRLLCAAPTGSSVQALADGRLLLVVSGVPKSFAVAIADGLVAEARSASVFGLRFPLSIGVATVPDDGEHAEQAIERAATAASRALARGGDVVLGYHAGMRTSDSVAPSGMVSALLARPKVPVEFRTIVSAKDGSPIAIAARCDGGAAASRGGGLLLDEAARVGRVFEFGQLVRASAASTFRVEDDGRKLLFVDVHPAELLRTSLILAEPSLADLLDRLVVQLLPSSEWIDADLARMVADRLRAKGVRFSVDDMNTRADGIGLLASVKPEFITLDARPLCDADRSERCVRAIESFVSLSRSLGAQLVAKVSGHASSTELLRDLGVPLFLLANEPAHAEQTP